MNEILKRDVVEGEKVKEAEIRVRKASRKLEKQKMIEDMRNEMRNMMSTENMK